MESAKAYLLLGGNLGDKLALIQQAIKQLANQYCTVKNCSSVWESEAWGFESSARFYNAVIQIETSLAPEALLNHCQQIEKNLGRVRDPNSSGYASRSMDIDILFYNQEVIHTKLLNIPHPKLHCRRFTLEPLKEIAPNFVHPVLKMSILQLLEECPDRVLAKAIISSIKI